MTNKKYSAVVTGATRGIGRAIAERLLKDGLEVIVTGTSKDAELSYWIKLLSSRLFK